MYTNAGTNTFVETNIDSKIYIHANTRTDNTCKSKSNMDTNTNTNIIFSVPSYVTNLCYNKLKSQLAYHYST